MYIYPSTFTIPAIIKLAVHSAGSCRNSIAVYCMSWIFCLFQVYVVRSSRESAGLLGKPVVESRVKK
jgi:hypothetical protein